MSFSSGVFSLVAGNPVVTGTTVSSTWANNTLSDIATGLSTCILKDGTQTTTAAIPFALGLTIPTGQSITGSGTASMTGMAITLLSTGAFTNGIGKIITSTRDISAVNGNVAYTGAGFKPSAVIILAVVNGTSKVSVGFDDATTPRGIGNAHAISSATWNYDVFPVQLYSGAAPDYATAKVASFDADGLTLTWAKTNSPTGTAQLFFFCLR